MKNIKTFLVGSQLLFDTIIITLKYNMSIILIKLLGIKQRKIFHHMIGYKVCHIRNLPFCEMMLVKIPYKQPFEFFCYVIKRFVLLLLVLLR